MVPQTRVRSHALRQPLTLDFNECQVLHILSIPHASLTNSGGGTPPQAVAWGWVPFPIYRHHHPIAALGLTTGEQGSPRAASHHQVPRGCLTLPALEIFSLYPRQFYIKQQAKLRTCPQILHKWDCTVKH